MNIKYYFGRILSRIYGVNKTPSYSSLHEDNILDWLTGYKKDGFYIDIGANNPDRINNTKLFYERGWKGINIEPDKNGYDLFCQKRPRDINLNCAVGDGEAIYYKDSGATVGNIFTKDLAKERGFVKEEKMILKPLREIFAENNLKMVDFISMDVEGFENEVLKSNDWEKYGARVLCIEGYKYDYLKQFGYKRVFWDGSNSYYKNTRFIHSTCN